MKHQVSDNASVNYDRETNEWVGTVHGENFDFETRSVELTQVMFVLMEVEALEPESYEWSNRNGIEQVLVVINTDEEDK